MKILYIVDYFQPDIGYASYWIPEEFSKMGYEVMILTSNYYYPFPNYEETAGKILGPRRLKAKTYKLGNIKVIREEMIAEIFTRAIFRGQEQCIRQFKPDIVFVDKSASYNAIVASLFKKKYGYKLVSIDAHLPSGFEATGNLISKVIFYFIFRVLFSNLINNTTDKFIAVQEKTQLIMRKYYGIKRKLVHIPLGTDITLFRFDRKSREKVRERYKVGNREFVLIYTGKIIKEKGVHILFQAFQVLSKTHKNIKLLLVGSADEKYRQYCLSFVDYEYKNKIIWAGFQKATDLYKYYSSAEVAVWPLQESMSMNDAAACEIPFIANSTIGARVRLSNNNALLYKKGNYYDLENKIEYLYENPKIRKAMGRRGRELMKEKLSWRAIARQYLNDI